MYFDREIALNILRTLHYITYFIFSFACIVLTVYGIYHSFLAPQANMIGAHYLFEPLFFIFWPLFGLLFGLVNHYLLNELLERFSNSLKTRQFVFSFAGALFLLIGSWSIYDNLTGQERTKAATAFYADIATGKSSIWIDHCLLGGGKHHNVNSGFTIPKEKREQCAQIISQVIATNSNTAFLSSSAESVLLHIEECHNKEEEEIASCLIIVRDDLRSASSVPSVIALISAGAVNVTSALIALSTGLMALSVTLRYGIASLPLLKVSPINISKKITILLLFQIMLTLLWFLFRLVKDYFINYTHFEWSANSVTISYLVIFFVVLWAFMNCVDESVETLNGFLQNIIFALGIVTAIYFGVGVFSDEFFDAAFAGVPVHFIPGFLILGAITVFTIMLALIQRLKTL